MKLIYRKRSVRVAIEYLPASAPALEEFQYRKR